MANIGIDISKEELARQCAAWRKEQYSLLEEIKALHAKNKTVTKLLEDFDDWLLRKTIPTTSHFDEVKHKFSSLLKEIERLNDNDK